MARITSQTKCRLCRRERAKLYLKGERCLSPKCSVTKSQNVPGQHGTVGRQSGYAIQFREKQKVKRIYGLLERQFRRFYELASKDKAQTGTKLLQLLEFKLDNVVYRLGMARSRNEARQLISHGHINVNGKRVTIPSYVVKVKDEISYNTDIVENKLVNELILETTKNEKLPLWLNMLKDGKKTVGVVEAVPSREQLDPSINEQLIVEYYSK